MHDPDRPADGVSPQDQLARVAARCFAGPNGRQLMAHLRAMTVERSLGPAADDRVLRHLEGQRQLVQHIQSLIDRGRRGPFPPPRPDDDNPTPPAIEE